MLPNFPFGVSIQGSPELPRGVGARVLPEDADHRYQSERRGKQNELPEGVLRQEKPKPADGRGDQQCGCPGGGR